jgi:hypothetical protein
MLSYTFLKSTGKDDIIVPMVSSISFSGKLDFILCFLQDATTILLEFSDWVSPIRIVQ